MKTDTVLRTDVSPSVISGDFVPIQSVIAVTNLTVTGPYRGDFQVVDQGRVIVGEDPDIGPRGILSAKALQGFNTNGLNTFAVWFATDAVHTAGDLHAGDAIGGNSLRYSQADGTLGLYTPDGAGVIMDNDGTFIAGHVEHGHMKWDAASVSLKIMSGTEMMAEIGDDGNAQFTGIITAQGGHITGRMFVDEVLQAGDTDGPAIYLGRFERTNALDELVETSEILATDINNLPWFHVVAGGESEGGGYFSLGGQGDYAQRLTYDGIDLVFDGTVYARGGTFTGVVEILAGGALVWAGGKGRADDTGIEHVETATNYWKVKPDASSFMEINTSGTTNYASLRITEDVGIGAYVTGGALGVHAESGIPSGTGLNAYSESGTGIRAQSSTGTAGVFSSFNEGRGVVGYTNAPALAGVVARNTGGGPALAVETSYAHLEAGLIVNAAGGATSISDTRIAGDTDTHLIFVDASADKVGISEDAPNATLDVNGTTRLGDSDTNYAAFAADGTLTLHGTAMYERHVQLPAIATGTPANQPTEVDFFTAGGLQYSTTGAKFAFCQWEIPDDWNGADMFFEIDWMPDSGATSGTDAVRWTVEYRAIAEGELINNGTSVTLDNGAGGDTTDYAQYQTKHSRMTMAYNDANQPLTAQDHLYFKISRDTFVEGDFGGTVTVLGYEIIYTSKGIPTN